MTVYVTPLITTCAVRLGPLLARVWTLTLLVPVNETSVAWTYEPVTGFFTSSQSASLLAVHEQDGAAVTFMYHVAATPVVPPRNKTTSYPG